MKTSKEIVLNIAGNKVIFTLNVNSYEGGADFRIMSNEGVIYLDGYVSNGFFGLGITSREIEFFQDVLIKKVKTELKRNKVKFY